MRVFILLACATFFCLAAPAVSSAQKKSADPAVERRAAFAWMDSLAYPNIKKLKFVKVATGYSRKNDDGELENSYIHGFLVQDDGAKFEIFDLNLERSSFKRTPVHALPHERVDHELAELGKFATAVLKQRELEAQEAKDEDGVRKQMVREMMAAMAGQRVSGRIMTFSLAWFCSHHGLNELAEKLYNQASDRAHDRGFDDDRTLQQKLAVELCTAHMWEAVVAFQNPEITRTALKEKFDRIVKHFPGMDHQQRAADSAAKLAQMIREDAEHNEERKKGKPIDQLSKSEKAKELVFQLREQTGFQWSQPGWCDIFRNIEGDESTPAHQLVVIGYDAVPALIDALGDNRFTRAVGYRRNFYFSHQVITVGACAHTILDRISGVTLSEGFYSKGIDTKNMTDVDRLKAETQAWYAELKKKGEKQWLIEVVERGENSGLADRLLEKYPQDALSTLIKGAQAAKEGWIRNNLVIGIGHIEGDESLRFLLTELKEGPFLQGRLAAARYLDKRKRPEALAAMTAEWRDQRFAKEQPDRWSGAAGGLPEFLAQSGKPEVIAALAAGLHKRSLDVRFEVADAMLCEPIREAFKDENENDKDLSKLRKAVENLLMAALDDTERQYGSSGSRGGKGYSNPHVCDMAGWVLNELNADKYPFDLEAAWSQRRGQIFAMKNDWRVANKLEPLPLRKLTPRTPDEKLRPLLDAFLTGGADKMRQTQGEIEKLGLPAFTGVLNRRNASASKEEAKRIDDLLKRLASIVSEIEMGENSLKPNTSMSKQLDGMKGRPLDSKVLFKMIGAALKNRPSGMVGMILTLERDEDGSGIRLRLDLMDLTRAGRAQRKEQATWVDYVTLGVMGSSQLSVWTDDHNVEEASRLDRALGSAPDLAIDFYLRLTLKWQD